MPSTAVPSQTCFPHVSKMAWGQTPRVPAGVEAQPASEAGPGHQLAVAVGEYVVMKRCSFETIGTARGNHPLCAFDGDRPKCGGSVAADVQGMIGHSPASPLSQSCCPVVVQVPETLPRLSQPEVAPAVWAV